MKIAIFLFDGVTALDAVGPYESLSRLPTTEIVFVGKAIGPVRTGNRFLALNADRAISDIVPDFPEHAQPVVSRVIDARVSELIYQHAFRALKAALPADPAAPLDPGAFRRQRDQVLALQSVLRETGGAGFGERLVATIDGELQRRLAALQDQWLQQPLQDPRATDFSWWQGDPLPLAQTLGVSSEGNPQQASVAGTALRLASLARQADALLALGGPRLADDPAATRWRQVKAELDRYQARSADSSLVRLEHYVNALGPDFSRQNCAERLAANAPATLPDDLVAQRQLQLHTALSQRCTELRVQMLMPAAAPQ